MKIVVFGATGGAGKAFVEQALAAGHEVTAVARRPEALSLSHERLRVVKGETSDGESVAAAVAGNDAVVLAIGPRPGTPPGTIISGATRNILAAVKRHGVQRFELVSGLMVGEARGMNFLQRPLIAFFRRMNHALFLDKKLAEELVTASELDWVIVRPPLFGDVPPTGKHRIGVDLDVKLTKMSNRDVADAMLAALTEAQYTRKIVEISV